MSVGRNVARLALAAVALAAATAGAWHAAQWRMPMLAEDRPQELRLILTLGGGALFAALLCNSRWLRGRGIARWLSGAGLLIAAVAIVYTLGVEGWHQWMRHSVQTADPTRLERLGRHVIVGYTEIEDVEVLVRRKAVGGIFLSVRNVVGRTADQIRGDIARVQAIRTEQGLPPLWVATDQEGGIVSRLSPPLPRQPPLSAVVSGSAAGPERSAAVADYAQTQARGIASIGINLNFAPVVDLNFSVVNPNDHNSRISQRAISADANVVTEVAGSYCDVLMTAGVRCTLKHFPGLGRVVNDTHVGAADLAAPVSELTLTDWLPFRSLMGRGAMTMVGHARLLAIDPDLPVSISQKVVGGLLRGEWRHDGPLVTDDFSMAAVYGSKPGIGGGAVLAINAGVDLLLVSFDEDLYYPLMYHLLQADAAGELKAAMLERSEQRLAPLSRALPPPPVAPASPRRDP